MKTLAEYKGIQPVEIEYKEKVTTMSLHIFTLIEDGIEWDYAVYHHKARQGVIIHELEPFEGELVYRRLQHSTPIVLMKEIIKVLDICETTHYNT